MLELNMKFREVMELIAHGSLAHPVAIPSESGGNLSVAVEFRGEDAEHVAQNARIIFRHMKNDLAKCFIDDDLADHIEDNRINFDLRKLYLLKDKPDTFSDAKAFILTYKKPNREFSGRIGSKAPAALIKNKNDEVTLLINRTPRGIN